MAQPPPSSLIDRRFDVGGPRDRRDLGATDEDVSAHCRTLFLFAFLLGAALPACNASRAPEAATPAAPNQAIEEGNEVIFARYAGRLPCADCAGIRIELTLNAETVHGPPTRYHMRETYIATRDGDRTFTSEGRWRIRRGSADDPNATVYQIDFDRPEKTRSFLVVDANELTALDRDLRELPSTLPRTLMRLEEGGNKRNGAGFDAHCDHSAGGNAGIVRASAQRQEGVRGWAARDPIAIAPGGQRPASRDFTG